MDTATLGRLFSKIDTVTSPYFRGVYKLDELENLDSVLDLNDMNVVMFFHARHFFGLFLSPTDNSSVFIDPIYRRPNKYGVEFNEMLNYYCPNFSVLPFQCQGVNSGLCAIYCLYFHDCLCQSISLETACALFSAFKFTSNDANLRDWFRARFKFVNFNDLFSA
jgi:hypothetical protein